MLDIQELRKDLDGVTAKLEKRGYEFNFETFTEVENERKAVQTRTQELQAKRNNASKQIGTAKSKGEDVSAIMAEIAGLGEQLKTDEARLTELQCQLQNMLLLVPNLPYVNIDEPEKSTPEGNSEADNVEVRKVGVPRTFNFAIKDHTDVGTPLGLDFDTGIKLSGARFTFMRGKIAKLHRALSQFMLDTQEKHGYEECYTPYLVNKETLTGTGQLPKFEEDLFRVKENALGIGDVREGLAFPDELIELNLAVEERNTYRALTWISDWYKLQGGLYLIPTSEVTLTNTVRDEIVALDALPIKLTAHTPCFRSEAGSYGKDTKGMIRQHQFDKVEMVQIVHPDKSYETLEEMVGHAENILKALELPYRVVLLCTGDMGFGAAKTYDLEVWLPAQNTYREVSSVSNCEAFQARRLQARFRNAQGKTEFVHTLNGSGLAVGRTLVAVLENYQNADGSVTIPKVLQPYMNGLEKISAK